MLNHKANTETHPLEPFIPEGARLLMLGSFPPKRERWSMDFFYPNWINDMWRIMGIVFFDDRNHFIAEGKDSKRFDKDACVSFAASAGLAMYDTAYEVRRIKDNASDKFLEIIRPADIISILGRLPHCRAVVTTGQKASQVICDLFGCDMPETGSYVEIGSGNAQGCGSLRFWRMPSSSRAYPMKLEDKAVFYRMMMMEEGLLR